MVRRRVQALPVVLQVVLMGAVSAVLAVVVGGVAAGAGLPVAGTGWRALFGLLVGVSRAGAVQRLLGGGRLDNRLALRLAVGYVLFAVLAEATGLPFLFPLGGALTATATLQWSGARTWRQTVLALVVASIGSASAGGALDAAGSFSSPLSKEEVGAIYFASAIIGFLTVLNAAALTAARETSDGALEDERTRRHDELLHAATHDALTGLLNRAGLVELLPQVLAEATLGRGVGVLYLDLDGFKSVNDSLGHQAGDELLRLAADRLVQAVRAGDLVARLGGDEFIVLARGIDKDENLHALAGRLDAALSAPFDLAAGPARVGASIGTALTRTASTSSDDLISRADAEMYQVKTVRHQRTRADAVVTRVR